MLKLKFEQLLLPDTPGIYFFYNKNKDLVYVGKATSLKNRVRSYFRIKRVTRPIEGMMHEVVSIKYKQTDSVLEAVILEANTIKAYLPKYNVLGKDNRSWNYIVITKDEYPQIKTMRQHEYELHRNLDRGRDHDYGRGGGDTSDFNVLDLRQFQYIFGPYP